MKNLIEKLKAVDKKVFIGIGVALVVVVVAIVAVVIGTSNKPANTDPDDTKPNNEYVANANDADDTSTSTTEDMSTSDEESSSEEDSSASEEDSTKGSSSNSSSSSSGSGSGNSNTTTAVQKPTATNPEGDEILGAGSESQPYLETPGSDFSVTTVKVPAGKALYYDIYRVGGMYLTINDADAYVICDGTKYTAKSGKVSFKVPNALASDAVSFQIGNNGSTAKSFTIKFSNPKGTYANPEKVSKLTGEFEISLAAGVETGYYYKYSAEKTGTIRFYITATEDSILVVTNNRNSAQRTTEADVLTDENGNEYIELEVSKGDEIIINVGAMPNKRGKYPATDITWRGVYA